MSNELMVKVFDGMEVIFMENGYINATKVAKSFGKDVRDWLYSQDNINYINELQNCGNFPQLVIVKEGRSGGTWLHPKLGIVFARWLSVKFAVWCDGQIERILHNYQISNARPQFPTELHPVLRFPVVGRHEDLLMKRTRNTYTAVLDSLGFAAAIYKRTLTNNVSRILIGMPVQPFRRLHGIPAGSRRRTRLYYDHNLRRAMDEIEDIACGSLREIAEDPNHNLGDFFEIEKVVYAVAKTVFSYVQLRRINLLEHVPEQELQELVSL